MKLTRRLFAFAATPFPAVRFQHGGKPNARYVALVELIASPEKFDNKLITVRGYLTLGPDSDITVSRLSLSEEDARNDLGNSVVVSINRKMYHGAESIDKRYVALIGTFRVVPVGGGGWIGTMKDIEGCEVLSGKN